MDSTSFSASIQDGCDTTVSDRSPRPDLHGIPVATSGDILFVSPPFQSVDRP
jgi:hypothetical protein